MLPALAVGCKHMNVLRSLVVCEKEICLYKTQHTFRRICREEHNCLKDQGERLSLKTNCWDVCVGYSP